LILSGSCFTLIAGGNGCHLDSGDQKMVVDLLDGETLFRLLMLMIWSVITIAIGYAKGFKDGRREGYARGKAIGRHSSNAVNK
jgi:hypothetical protein